MRVLLSDATGVPYYRQIVDQVAERVRCGELRPGERLPSVRQLAAELVVSLITTRRAYAELEKAGLIVRRQGAGTFVADDVRAASTRQAMREVDGLLRAAVDRARRLGLDERDLERCWEAACGRKRGRGDER